MVQIQQQTFSGGQNEIGHSITPNVSTLMACVYILLMQTGMVTGVPNCAICNKSVEHVLFEFASFDSQRRIFWTA